MSVAVPGTASSTPTVQTFFRRWSFWIGAAVFVVIASLVLLLIRGAGGGGGGDLSTTTAAPSGAKAMAEVLRQQGVTVTAVDSLDAAVRAVRDAGGGAAAGPASGSADPATPTVLIYDPDGLLPLDRTADLTALGSKLVLVEPDIFVLNALAPSISLTGRVDDGGVTAAGCSVPAAERAGAISPSGAAYRAIDSSAAGTTECFPVDDGYALVQSDDGDRAVTVLGASGILTNEHVIESGDAALALALLGTSDDLVWYLPSEADVTASGPPDLADLTPGWVTPLMLLLAVVFVTAAVWRGRRLGPVVVENLPVIVRGSETVAGRARLYSRSSARTRALDALRIGTVTRVSGLLGLPRTAGLPDVVAAVASVTGLVPNEVADVFVNRLPRSEAELLALSQQLAAIERRVQVAVGRAPGGTGTGGGGGGGATGTGGTGGGAGTRPPGTGTGTGTNSLADSPHHDTEGRS